MAVLDHNTRCSFESSGQMNAIVPYETGSVGATTIQVIVGFIPRECTCWLWKMSDPYLAMAAHGAKKLFSWFGGSGLKGTRAFLESIWFRQGSRFALMAGLKPTLERLPFL